MRARPQDEMSLTRSIVDGSSQAGAGDEAIRRRAIVLGAAAEARHTVTRLRRAIKYWVGLGSRQRSFYGPESRIEDSSQYHIEATLWRISVVQLTRLRLV